MFLRLCPPPPPPLIHDASPSILFLSPLWPNWWVNTNKLPSLHFPITSWSWKASLPQSRGAHLLVLLPHPPLSLLCSLFIRFPFGSWESRGMAELIGRLNSWPKGTRVMSACTRGREVKDSDWLIDWHTKKQGNGIRQKRSLSVVRKQEARWDAGCRQKQHVQHIFKTPRKHPSFSVIILICFDFIMIPKKVEEGRLSWGLSTLFSGIIHAGDYSSRITTLVPAFELTL